MKKTDREAINARDAQMEILFVCQGNTCRSPMAAALFRALAREMGLEGIVASSAGMRAQLGDGAAPEAVQVLDDRGIDLRGHSARPLAAALIDEADLVLTMTNDYKRRALGLAQGASPKVFTLGEYAGTYEEVPDPIGRGKQAYEECANSLERMLRKVIVRLK